MEFSKEIGKNSKPHDFVVLSEKCHPYRMLALFLNVGVVAGMWGLGEFAYSTG
jgi:hypothetical protein